MFWASVAITIGMIVLALWATRARPERKPVVGARAFVLGGGVLFPSLVVLALLVYGVRSGEALLPLPTDRDVFRVEIVAHQWWWEVRYPDAEGGALHAANELHIPVGQPVDVQVTTGDVIHSFWVPRLGGKIDAIPGEVNVIRIEADRPGLFHGQCAEFCGAQHARMALVVEAHEPEALAGRLALLAASGELPRHPAFEESCAACHSRDPRVGGIAPNLADLPLRHRLGAGLIENTPETLRLWLDEHQTLKPGNHMPLHDHLEAEVLDAIAAYLGSRP